MDAGPNIPPFSRAPDPSLPAFLVLCRGSCRGLIWQLHCICAQQQAYSRLDQASADQPRDCLEPKSRQ
eukprot:3454836-Rhodomonas_salina.2